MAFAKPRALLDAWDERCDNCDDVAQELTGAVAALRASLATSAAARTPIDRSNARPETKQAQVLAMLSRGDGASGPQIAEAMGWAPHTVRGFLAGVPKKALRLKSSGVFARSDGKVAVRTVALRSTASATAIIDESLSDAQSAKLNAMRTVTWWEDIDCPSLSIRGLATARLLLPLCPLAITPIMLASLPRSRHGRDYYAALY